MKSTLRLFNAVPATGKFNTRPVQEYADVLARAFSNGITFTPYVLASYSPEALSSVLDDAISLYGTNPDHLNSSLHKSWEKVATAPIGQLLLEQAMHYMSTYDAALLDVFDKGNIYIPAEELNVPEWSEDIDLKLISLITFNDMKTRSMNLATSGVALSDETMGDLMSVFDLVGIDESEIGSIRNRELASKLYLTWKLVPADPVEFLRLAVYATTGSAMLIKNPSTCYLIKNSDTPAEDIVSLFSSYGQTVGYAALSSIFLRYKPLFLAFKGSDKRMNSIVNELRRLSVTNHKPMKLGVLDRVFDQDVDVNELANALESTTPFRRIRILNSMTYRLRGEKPVVYTVRNGKTWSTTRDSVAPVRQDVFETVLNSVVGCLSSLSGKTVFIPEGVHLTLPSSEKTFCGNFPSGSSIEVRKDMVFGVHWTDLDGKGHYRDGRIDLDLSASSIAGKLGWDGAYRDGERTMLFSGDETAAPLPNGASEMFHVMNHNGLYLVNLNYYNFSEGYPVPFKLFVASDKRKNLSGNYMVDQNQVLAAIPMVIDKHHKQLGLLRTSEQSSRFFFIGGDASEGRSFNGYKEFHEWSRQFYLGFYETAISLRQVLELAGATVVSSMEEGMEVDLDLSPNSLTKDAILGIFNS